MSTLDQEWMKGEWDGKIFYKTAEWMKGEWNVFFFYELNKLGEDACLKFCMDNGLVTKHYECPLCGENMKLLDRKDAIDKKHWNCLKSGTNAHQSKRSVRKGTWFGKSHLGLGRILMLMYMWLNELPNESITNDLGVTSKTLIDWKNFCREVCVDYCLSFDGQIGGVGKTIEIYDSKLSELKCRKDMFKKHNFVFAGLVRPGLENLNEYFFELVKDRSGEKLVEVIKRRVLPGSTIILNCSSVCTMAHQILQELGTYNIDVDRKPDFSWSVVTRALQGTDIDGEFNGRTAEYIWRRQNNLPITKKVQSFLAAISKAFPPKSKD